MIILPIFSKIIKKRQEATNLTQLLDSLLPLPTGDRVKVGLLRTIRRWAVVEYSISEIKF